MYRIYLITFICIFSNFLFANSVIDTNLTSKVNFKLNGNINFNIHHHKGISQYSYFLNFGGPNVKIDWGKCGIAFGMFPSIRFYDHKIFTIIGTGFQFSYKKWSIVTPMYYIVSPVSKRNIWIVSYGVGYKL